MDYPVPALHVNMGWASKSLIPFNMDKRIHGMINILRIFLPYPW